MSAALSLTPLYLLGLGLLAAAPMLRRPPPAPRTPDCAGVAGLLALGILANHVLVLTLRSLTVSLTVGSALALVGLVLGLRARSKPRDPETPRPGEPNVWRAVFGLAIAAIVGLYAVLIFTLPLTHWDARSIWFFHAKILYFAGELTRESPWGALDFAHGDYPKLLPALAAQVAVVAGYWNEYLPKAALFVLLVPAAIGYTAFVRRPVSGLFLIAMVFFSAYGELWNGYADGYLALYAGLGVLALGRWIEVRHRGDLLLGLASLGIAASLKNEGVFFLLCAAVAFAITAVTARPSARERAEPPAVGAAPVAWIAGVSLAGPVIWAATKRSWGLTSDLRLTSETLTIAWGRLSEPADFTAILQTLFRTFELAGAAVPLALALLATALLRLRVPTRCRLPLVTGVLYLTVIFGAYLGTPHELDWHLATSAGRTVLPIFVCFSAATFQLLDAIERGPASKQP